MRDAEIYINEQGILHKLAANLGGVKFGEVAVLLKVHDGRVVAVTHTVTSSTRQSAGVNNSEGAENVSL
jgi:hypothetical protein